MTHSKYSPSSSQRWLNCSVSMDIEVKDTISIAATEGSCAHEVAEKSLKSDRDADFFIGEMFYEQLVTKEMCDNVQRYVDYCRSFMTPYSEYEVESKVSFEDIVPGGFGTCDFIIFNKETKTLDVIDFKFGFLEVSAYMNTQCLLYAYGAYSKYIKNYDIENVVLHIVQPRINNFDTFRLTKNEFLGIVEELKERSQNVFNGISITQPSMKVCKYCSAFTTCKIFNDRVKRVVSKIVLNKEDNVLTDDEREYIIANGSMIIDYINKITEDVRTRLMEGEEVKGFKLHGKNKRNFSKWTMDAMDSLKDYEDLLETKLVTITTARKIIKENGYEIDIDKYTEKNNEQEVLPILVRDKEYKESKDYFNLRSKIASNMFNSI